MSREILFKAKRKNWEKLPREEWWVEGYYVYDHCKNIHLILRNELSTCLNAGSKPNRRDWILEPYEIDPETLCQYVDLPDKNGRKIWENDIVKHEDSQSIGTVKWYQGDYIGWCVDDVYNGEQQFTKEMWNECEIIENIFDNLELLKE